MRIGAAYPEPVHRAVIRTAHGHGVPNLAVQLAAAAGVALEGARGDAAWYAAWFVLGIIVLGVRVAAGLRLGKAIRDPQVGFEPLRRRQFAPIALLILSAAMWSALAILRLPVEGLAQSFTIIVVLSALTGGAVGVLSPLLWTGRAYITLMLVPASLLLLDSMETPLLGLLGLAFWVVMLMAHNANHRLLVQSIQLGLENVALTDALRARTEEVEAANDELEARVAVRTRELSDMATKAQAASRAKSEFLATISHEIRTPLNGVIGMAQVMEYHPLSRAQRERLGLIQSSAGALLAIINDVLDISKIESGRMEPHIEPFDVQAFCAGLERIYAPLSRDKGLGFRMTFETGAPTMRLGDALKFRQIVSNLISNAIKFTAQGEVGIEISFAGDEVHCSVWDTGAGIPPEMRDAVFEPFVQVDGSATRQAGGTGLGLAICRDLATLLGGEIELTSAVGAGSRFDVRLPMPAVEVADEADAPREAAADHGNSRILVVDDNANNRLVLQSLLRQFDIASGCAADGAQAVEAWSETPWDAILMDVHMPVTDGLEATRRIRALERQRGLARTPIIAVTASVMSHETEAYFAAGMDGVLGKPIQIGELIGVLQDKLAPAEAA